MYIPNINSFFIHIPKCAGTSIELMFFEKHGLQISEQKIDQQLTKEQRELFHFSDRINGINYESQHILANHAKILLPAFRNSDYTFTVVRNPWDRFISEFFWRKKVLQSNLTIAMLIDSFSKRNHIHSMPMWSFIVDEDGNQLVDDVFRVEEIHELETTLNDKFDLDLKMSKRNQTVDRKHYSEYYTHEMKEILAPIFQKDCEMFGYEF